MPLANKTRNEDIIRRHHAGESVKQLAKAYHVTQARISQIKAAHRKRQVKASSTARPAANSVSTPSTEPFTAPAWEIEGVSTPQTSVGAAPRQHLQSLLTRYLLQAIIDAGSADTAEQKARLLDNLIREFARLRLEL